jgi:hypothetical protein
VLYQGKSDNTSTVQVVPDGFKVVQTEYGPISIAGPATSRLGHSDPERGLGNGQRGAHTGGMPKAPRLRLLEVNLIPLKPDRWEWQVCEGDKPIAKGFETTRETAQIEGDSALFRLLSAGLDK